MPTLSMTASGADGMTVTNSPDDDAILESVTRPSKVWRRARATSPYAHGSLQTQATLEDGQIEAVVNAQAASAAALDALRTQIEAAFVDQFSFTLTITEDGVTKAYVADGADISWNEHDSGMAQAKLAKATLTFTVYPVAS